MYKSTNGGKFWSKINNGLAITQFYAMAIDFSQKNKNYGGTQDNGSVGVQTNSWFNVAGGDGFDIFVHPTDPRIVFGELYYGAPFRYTDYGGGNDDLKYLDKNLPSNDSGAWHAPFLIDENSSTIYLGMHAIYASYDFGEGWIPLTKRYTHQFSAIGFSNSKSRIIYGGNSTGELYLSTNSGNTWNLINAEGMPRNLITDIKTSKFKDSVAYISYSGFGAPHLYKTTNLGIKWTDISSNLPDIPVNAIVIHPENEDVLFAGTDIGVFASYDGGTVWMPFGRNLPRSPVTDLVFHKNKINAPGLTLRAATHGRSLWEITVPVESVTSAEITSPGGGEVCYGSTNFNLSWYGFNMPAKIEYSLNDGTDWLPINSNVTGNAMLWKLPDITSLSCRIKITSLVDAVSKISNSFSIKKEEKGSPLGTASVSFTTYGIAFDGKNSLWAVDYYSNNVYRLDADNYHITKKINSPGDQLFTDVTYSKQNNFLYIHRLKDTQGNGAYIEVIDTNGNKINEFNSPATEYPIGLTFDGTNLYAAERDGNQQVYVANPQNGTIIRQFDNPFKSQYGPRCLAFYNGNLFQVSTEYASSILNDVNALVFNPNSPQQIIDKIPLTAEEKINARGIDIDTRDGNIWITDFSGNIFKVYAGLEITSVENRKSIDFKIALNPNPAKEYLNIVYHYKTEGTLKFEIIDAIGNTLIQSEDLVNSSSTGSKTININNLSSGIYFLRHSINGIIIGVEKFIKI